MADRCKRCDSQWEGQIYQVRNGGELTAILGLNFSDADLLANGSASGFTDFQLGIVLC